MDLQTRKIEFVQEFLKLQSEEAVIRLEKVLEEELSSHSETPSISAENLNKRIDHSMKDSEAGRLTENEDLISEIKNWR
ncbi:hypothetical protein MKO06_08820 [Gramella sp. GC03-9]|uniref:Addiction module component n=1 Tax=Christiangramia oceanisediminis TaxID=2920386 RepID=A0A9X2KWA1_9FLAO|nr:hypothetical protein [Gramella oceanisediminis]MCP9200007.1 hypothetical protein [Gramella oceanisediminis]